MDGSRRGVGGSSVLGRTGGMTLGSAKPAAATAGAGAGAAAYGASAGLTFTDARSSAKNGLYSFDTRELDQFVLAKPRPAAVAAAAAAATNTAAATLRATAALPAATAAAAGQLPHAHASSGRRADGVEVAPDAGHAHHKHAPIVLPPDVAATHHLLKTAFGLTNDEHKSKEADEAVASLLTSTNRLKVGSAAATGKAGAGGSGGGAMLAGGAATATGTTGGAVGGMAASTGLTGGDPMAVAALAEVGTLRTGEEAIAFFLKYGPTCPVKFVNLVRAFPEGRDVYRPYDLAVRRGDTGPDYFVMSAKGVVHIQPGEVFG
ncbi:hypothetical protein EON68_02140, partial [archaeon]